MALSAPLSWGGVCEGLYPTGHPQPRTQPGRLLPFLPPSEGQGSSTDVAGTALPFHERLVRQQKAWASSHLTVALGSTSAQV